MTISGIKTVIRNIRKKLIAISILFFVTGAVITFAGYSMTGFDPSRLDLHEEAKWYQTVHMENGNFWVGIGIGDGRIIVGSEF